jgi:hypothetical protein
MSTKDEWRLFALDLAINVSERSAATGRYAESICFAFAITLWQARRRFGQDPRFPQRIKDFHCRLDQCFSEGEYEGMTIQGRPLTVEVCRERIQEYVPLLDQDPTFALALRALADHALSPITAATQKSIAQWLHTALKGFDSIPFDVQPPAPKTEAPKPAETAPAAPTPPKDTSSSPDAVEAVLEAAVYAGGCLSIGFLQIVLAALPIAVALLMVIVILKACS